VTVSATLVDTSLGTYRNWVQITDDSAGTFSTLTETVVDRDSTPANGEQGEDDDDPAVFEIAPVTPSGTTIAGDPGSGTGGSLVATGASIALATALGASLAAGGAALVTSTRRRRRPTGLR
jgi:hypothetical protein